MTKYFWVILVVAAVCVSLTVFALKSYFVGSSPNKQLTSRYPEGFETKTVKAENQFYRRLPVILSTKYEN